jgi:hypothetical protein
MSPDILMGIFDESVVKYAVIHEFGDKGNDFLRVAYDTHLDDILKCTEQEYGKVMDGMLDKKKKYDIKIARTNIGAYVVKLIKDKIIEKGLIDTGKMLNSIEVKVEG